MDPSRNLLSCVLAGLLLFSNTACTCASMSSAAGDKNADNGLGSSPHAHHQLQDLQTENDTANGTDSRSGPCAHQNCENCTSLTLSGLPEWAGVCAGLARLDPDNDVIWSDLMSVDVPQSLASMAHSGPPFLPNARHADTPVQRADLLLE